MASRAGADFRPSTEGQPLTIDRFRKLLNAAAFQVLREDETGEPSGRAWTEAGELDKLGHALQGKLAPSIDDQVSLLVERIESLLDAGWREVRVVTDSRLALVTGWPAEGRPPPISNGKPLGALCVDQRRVRH